MDNDQKRAPRFAPDQANAFLAAIVESSTDAIITKDLGGIITSWNKSAERLFGYTAEEIVGRSITLLIPPDRLNEEPEILSRLKKGERVDHYHTLRRRKDGSEVIVSLTVSPVVDENGRLIGASKIARDITGERATFDELRRSEERYRVTLGSIGDAVIATDLAGRVTFMNPVAEQLTGWTLSEGLAQPLQNVFSIVNELTHEPVENPVARVIEHGVIVELANHTLLKSRTGKEWPIADSAAPIHDSDGVLNGVVLVFREVSEQRAAELAARRLAAIVESSDDAIVSKDLQGVVMSWNKAAERIFGYSAEEMIGQSITVLFPPDRLNEEHLILERLQKGERVDHFETVRVTKTGRQLAVSLTISPIKDSDGLIVGASKIARDITDQKWAEKELLAAHGKLRAHAGELEERVRERTAELQRALVELESFSYSISHDMRAPLRAMQQYAEALLQEYGGAIGPEGQRYLDRIIGSAQRLDVLIRDVLTYSQVLRAPLTLHPVDLEPLITTIIQSYPALQNPRAVIEVRGPLARVKAHEAFLTQALSNLLGNAVKFVKPDLRPHVRVWTEPAGTAVRLFVQDNGIGIPVEHHGRIFGMFERVHDEKRYEGTGIGLAIVRKAAQRMGGRVGLDSRAGEGSTFWLELPAA